MIVMDIEEFRKLEKLEWRKRTKKCAKIGVVFENAKNKIKYYNNLPKAKVYNEACKKVLDARKGSSSLVNDDGSISEDSLKIIVYGLRKFEMNRFNQMGNTFRERLSKKLQKDEIKEILRNLRDLRIESEEWKERKDDIRKLYNELSTEGEDSLHADKKRFDVGATKIMNFLFPELFVIVDKHVAETLKRLGLIEIQRKGSTYNFLFESFWQAMEICYKELEHYRKNHDNLQTLLDMDSKPTTFTRIFDKCAFALAKNKKTLTKT